MKCRPLNRSHSPSIEVRREAAVWIARIHSPDRTSQVESGLRRWLKESPEHQRAFELANELWDVASHIPDGAVPRMMRWKRVTAPMGHGFARAAAMGAALLALLIVPAGAFYYLHDRTLSTDVGEQRTVTLKDGTRVSLNTATRLIVRYEQRTRRVQLESGEALFEVANQASRPFIVTAGNRNVEALGTSFVVLHDRRQTAVTLVEGKVAVSAVAAEDPALAPPSDTVVLTPGNRITFPVNAPAPKIDRPKLEKLIAWRRGLIALDYTPLIDAAAEMNRYSDVKVVIHNPEAAAARISGVFRAGDSLSFAQAIAKTYRLDVAQASGRIVISGKPVQLQ